MTALHTDLRSRVNASFDGWSVRGASRIETLPGMNGYSQLPSLWSRAGSLEHSAPVPEKVLSVLI